MSQFINFFYAQHVSDINTSIIRSLRLLYCITTLVVCSCSCVAGWSTASACNTDTTPTSHTETPAHIETRTHDQCGDTIEKLQAPDDGCINVRNMLSIEEVNKLWHQVGLLFFNYHNDARSNTHTHTHTKGLKFRQVISDAKFSTY